MKSLAAALFLLVSTLPAMAECPRKDQDVARVQEDAKAMAKDPGWEKLEYHHLNDLHTTNLIVKALGLNFVQTQPAQVGYMYHPDKMNAYVVFFSAEGCHINAIPVPLKVWERILKSVLSPA